MIALIILLYLAGAVLAYYLTRKVQKDQYYTRDWDDVKGCLTMAVISWVGAAIAYWNLLADTDPPSWL